MFIKQIGDEMSKIISEVQMVQGINLVPGIFQLSWKSNMECETSNLWGTSSYKT